MKKYKPLFEKLLTTIEIDKTVTEVYINPKSIKNFPSTVRGVINSNGDLIVWDKLTVLHYDIIPILVSKGFLDLPRDLLKSMKQSGYTHNTIFYDVLCIQEFIGSKGVFGVGESNNESMLKDLREKVKSIIGKAQKVNPQFTFINQQVG